MKQLKTVLVVNALSSAAAWVALMALLQYKGLNEINQRSATL